MEKVREDDKIKVCTRVFHRALAKFGIYTLECANVPNSDPNTIMIDFGSGPTEVTKKLLSYAEAEWRPIEEAEKEYKVEYVTTDGYSIRVCDFNAHLNSWVISGTEKRFEPTHFKIVSVPSVLPEAEGSLQ